VVFEPTNTCRYRQLRLSLSSYFLFFLDFQPKEVKLATCYLQVGSAVMPTITALSRQSKSRASSLCANVEGSGNVSLPLTSEA